MKKTIQKRSSLRHTDTLLLARIKQAIFHASPMAKSWRRIKKTDLVSQYFPRFHYALVNALNESEPFLTDGVTFAYSDIQRIDTVADLLDKVVRKYVERKDKEKTAKRKLSKKKIASKVKVVGVSSPVRSKPPVFSSPAASYYPSSKPKASPAKAASVTVAAKKLKNSVMVPVFHATNRSKTGEKKPNNYFGNEIAEKLLYGRTDVSIPMSHTHGELERPGLLWAEDERKHIMIQKITDLSEKVFFRNLAGRIAESGKKSTFVFVHGFNVNFDDAARRAAQISYDLFKVGIERKTAILETIPVLFSWPSYGKVSKYVADQNNAENSVLQLTQFLIDIKERTEAESINIIAHSMGNRLLVRTLRELKLRYGDACPFLDQVIMAAPDVNRRYFSDRALDILAPANRLTLYASDRDRALGVSKTVNGQFRVGDSENGVFIQKGMDSIDASSAGEDFLAHSAFAETPILKDLYQILAKNKRPSKRTGLTRHSSGRHWVLSH